MTSPQQPSPADAFRRAIRSGDFTAARTALDVYLGPLFAGAPVLDDVAAARDLLADALPAVVARRAELAADLARLANLRRGYCRTPASNTWRVDA
jgi:hypothetical protein